MMIDEIEAAIASLASADSCGFFWRRPIVKTLDAERGDLASLKTSVSPDHLLPQDVLPGAKGILCFFIPFDAAVVRSNEFGSMASREWAECYIRTNALIARINDEVESILGAAGYRVGKIPATHNFDVEKLISNWSHRHIAVLSGLGSLGLNNMLITDSGCCGRVGSIVTDFAFDSAPTAKTAEMCLNKINGSCGVCVSRCENGAYREGLFDRHACYGACLKNAEHHKGIGYADVCGKCLVGLPCSMVDPSKKLRSSSSGS